MAGHCILQAKRATLARLLSWRGSPMKRRGVSRHGFPPPVHGDTPVSAGFSRRPAHPADPADHAGQTAGPPVIFWGWRGQWAIEIQEQAVR
jgi:hypothetical protein